MGETLMHAFVVLSLMKSVFKLCQPLRNLEASQSESAAFNQLQMTNS